MKHSLVRRFLLFDLSIILFSFTALLWYVSSLVSTNYHEYTEDRLEEKAVLTANALGTESDPARIRELVAGLSAGTVGRTTIILPDGTVVADTDKDPALLANHGDREEVRRALSGDASFARRTSDSLSEDFLYFAMPVYRDGGIVCIVRTAAKLDASKRGLNGLRAAIFLAGLAAVILVSLGSYVLAKQFNAPIAKIQRAAQRFAQGDFDVRIAADRPDEIKALASTMNWMAEQLKNRMETVNSQRRDLETILAGMVEAVVVLASDLTIRTMNPAAERLFGTERAACAGRNVLEALRTADIEALARELLSGKGPVERTLELRTPRRVLHLQAHGTLLASSPGEGERALLVFNDVTRLKQLEKVRKDFVANVSHELRTPITSIQGFVETLKDGAIEDKETAAAFLDIIEKQTKRLDSIIEDLLALSRLEQSNTEITMEAADFSEILDRVFELCLPGARTKGVSLGRDCPEGLRAVVNSILVEQAVTNLVDNAIKYSGAGSTVRVSVSEDGEEILVTVEDDGPGIPSKDLPRIFERFYRVDKARSRALGGTGLGLAIVKHIALAHGGTVSAESEVGKGSRFYLRFPKRA